MIRFNLVRTFAFLLFASVCAVWIYTKLLVVPEVVRKWWNWQTHHLEGVAPKGVGVQIPPSAPKVLNLVF